MELVKRLYNEEEGQGMIEYVLILAGIAVLCIGLITPIGTKIAAIWNSVLAALP
jgi:pilus assembly protein Flp/PilA